LYAGRTHDLAHFVFRGKGRGLTEEIVALLEEPGWQLLLPRVAAVGSLAHSPLVVGMLALLMETLLAGQWQRRWMASRSSQCITHVHVNDL